MSFPLPAKDFGRMGRTERRTPTARPASLISAAPEYHPIEKLSRALLVRFHSLGPEGIFGSGAILAFDPFTGACKDSLRDAMNAPISIDGLWTISFGGGTTSGPSNTLFFTAGSG